jgi:hypothetical protein
MLTKRSFSLLSLCFVLLALGLTACGPVTAVPTATPTSTLTPTRTPTPIKTATPTANQILPPTSTSTPAPQAGSEPQAWLDGAIDVEQFPPKGAIVIHFNTPMDPGSNPNPVLAWPNLEGTASWDQAHTSLTFTPAQRLNNNATYTFFLDPSLRSADGKLLQNPPEWQIWTRMGPTVLEVSPQAGNLERRYQEIEIIFDQEMEPHVETGIVAIEPSTPFTLKWKTARALQIQLEKPFAFDQYYRLTLHSDLSSASGGRLENEFSWDYQQLSPQVRIESLTETEVRLAFNYTFDQQKTGAGFSISPTLEGKWLWVSGNQALFKSAAPIPANQIYTISYPSPLLDANGIEVTGLEKLKFSGAPPIHLLADTGWDDRKYKIRENVYDEVAYYYANYDTEAIRLEFLVPVDRASAEKAFSLTPPAPGTIAWETGDQGRDVLVYRLSQQLESSTKYTIRLNPGIRSAAGQPLIAEPFIKTIGVDEYRVGPCFGDLGSNIQVLDAQGTRRLQYAPGQKEVSFSAHRFDLIDFVKLYPPLRNRSSAGVKIPIPSGNKPAATWSNSTKRDVGDGQSVVETALPSSLEPGLYVVNAYAEKKLYDQMFVVLTRNTLVVKDNGHKLTAWVTDINGKAVEKAEIRVYNARGEKIREGQSDENGLYSISVPVGETAILVAARVRESHKPDDVTITALDLDAALGDNNDWFSSWFSSWESDNDYVGYDDPGYGLPVDGPLLAYTYTDRPVYRPGQTVNFKAVLRQDDDLRYSLPATGTPVTVRVLDGRGNVLHTLTLATNDFGSVHGDFLVPDGAMLGKYRIETEINGLSDSQYFRVEDYRKPDYQVTVTSLQPEKQNRYVQGEDVKVQVHVAYYFGEPVAGAELKADTFRKFSASSTVSGETATDAEGNATLTIQAPYDDPEYYGWWETGKQNVRLQISVDDGSHQSVTGQYYFDVSPAPTSLASIQADISLNPASPSPSISVIRISSTSPLPSGS